MSALIPVFLVRIRIEERMLTEEFEEAYINYMMSTKKLNPFIYYLKNIFWQSAEVNNF